VKKCVNDPQQFVPEMLKGVELANPGTLRYVPEYNLIMRADAPREDKVSIVQGSGSGHEPAHVMIVGKGMLDAACPGDVFAAQPSDYVYETTKLLATPKGVLHIIDNYTGDKMAFDMGTELDAVVTDLPYEPGDDVALMINGLGGTPISELYILYGRAHQLADKGINVTRSYVGEYCTSLDMAGASLTLVKLDDELNRLFDAPAEVAVRVF
jgi:dihydroxyacetone kinase